MLVSADAQLLRASANKQQIRRLETPTGVDQITFNGDIDDLDTDAIAGIFATTNYGGFLKFVDGETGAKAILITKCTQAGGEVGAVICSKSGGEQCVPFSTLKDLSHSERGGYCESVKSPFSGRKDSQYPPRSLSERSLRRKKGTHCSPLLLEQMTAPSAPVGWVHLVVKMALAPVSPSMNLRKLP
jgi:hypothetical protein